MRQCIGVPIYSHAWMLISDIVVLLIKMVAFAKLWNSSRWQLCLFLQVVALLLAVVVCHDPCPESLRQTAAARPCNIPRSEVEKAFQEAEKIAQKRKEKEKQLVSQGKTVNRKVKSPSSTHPQAYVKSEFRDMELRQLDFQEASSILSEKYKLSPEQVACCLPKVPLSDPVSARAVGRCVSTDPIQCDSSSRYRTADGTCNNLNNPTWGSALSCFQRLLPPQYSVNDTFRRAVDGSELPPPRVISLDVHYPLDRPTSYVNNMYMFFGQLLDHDITFTAPSATEDNLPIECCPATGDSHPQCAAIIPPQNDPFYSRYGIRCLNFVRSAMCPYCTAGPRQQINQMTAFVDASFVYGNNLNETNGLRANDGTGRLRMQRTTPRELLPLSDDPQNDLCSIPDQNLICFQAGDQRANQHPPLLSLHTAFAREHNRIADILRTQNPRWNDERIFQEARRIVGAEMQNIVYCEYLPVTIGNDRMNYFELWSSKESRYNETADPTLYTEFSTAAFRFGHTLIDGRIREVYNRHNGHLLRDVFFYPFFTDNSEIDVLLRGATQSSAQFFDRFMTRDVTDFLYRVPGNDTGFDLASFNIQRGRDHGLPTYVEMVRYCSQGSIDVRTFDDLSRYSLMSNDNIQALQRNYRSVYDIDMFPGIISEMYSGGAVVGPTARCIIGIQFYKLKFGDRFFFQHTGQAGSFTAAQRNEIKKSSLAKILCDNTGITEMQRQAMLWPDKYNNPVYSCSSLPAMDLSMWRE